MNKTERFITKIALLGCCQAAAYLFVPNDNQTIHLTANIASVHVALLLIYFLDKLLDRREQKKREQIEYLWKCKLKSRQSFIVILESINVKRSKLQDMLCLMKPEGAGAFYDNYVAKNFCFSKHNMRNSEIIYTDNEPASLAPGWIPTQS